MAKVISINTSRQPSSKDVDTADQIKKYEALLKDFPKREAYYTRLMILYRKEKNYKKELALIEKGLKIFEQLMQPRITHSKNVLALSKKLNKAFGLVDAKGKSVHAQEPILKWEKRKMIVLKKIGRQ